MGRGRIRLTVCDDDTGGAEEGVELDGGVYQDRFRHVFVQRVKDGEEVELLE